MNFKWVKPLLNTVLPPCCIACGTPLGGEEELCQRCCEDLVWLPATICARCAQPLPCDPCPAATAAFSAAWAPLAYDGTARALVKQLKYRYIFCAASVMARQLAERLPAELCQANPQVVPVPASSRRMRQHGFNQAQLLAEELAKQCGLVFNDCLRRDDCASTQVGAGRTQRRTAAAREISVCTAVTEQQVLLVDDVHTTGATLDACASALKQVGVQDVVAITYARTLP